MPILSLAGITVVAVDSTAPILTSPTGTQTGQTTATGTVTTDEANGTLYSLVSVNATETAATVKASGSSQAVSGTGVQNVSKTGLTQGTTYYLHYVHTDSAANDSGRVSSASFTTQTTAIQMVLAGVTVALEAETISSISGSTAGSTITVNTGGVRNLTVNAPTLTYGGIACTSITVIDADTFTAVMPSAGLALGSSNNFVLTVLGVQSAPAARTFNPALGQHATFTVPFAQFAPDSLFRVAALVGFVEGIVAGDQVDIGLKSNATTSTPGGYDVNVDTAGNIYLTDPSGSAGNLLAETELVSVTIALIDASDAYARSGNMIADLSLAAPAGTLTLGTPSLSATVASLPFSWTGTNATGFEYQIGSGSIIAIAASPIGLSALTASTAYTYRVRPVNGSWPGAWVSGSFTTTSATDTTPNAFSFTAQTGAQISTVAVSSSAAITGVSAGVDIAATVANGEWSFSSDSGVTWSAWGTGAGNVRLNYLVRVRRTSSASYLTPATVTLTVGGVAGVFSVTTRQDDIAPVVTLNGSSAITLPSGQAWAEPGATATDNISGAVAVVITGTVNTSVAGAYTLTYTATDAAGNVGVVYRVVTVSAESNLVIDSAPASIQWNGTLAQIIVSGAAVAPTINNTSVNFGGVPLYIESITGTGPWVITVTAWRGSDPEGGTTDLMLSNNGYPIVVTIGSETAQTVNVPYLPPIYGAVVTLTSVATGVNSIGDHFTEFPLAVGQQIIFRALTNPDAIGVTISTSGLVTYSGPQTRQNTFPYRVIRPNLAGASLQYTFGADTTPPVITLNGPAFQTVLQNSTWGDQGASAFDSVNGDLTAQIVATGTINTANLGGQTRTYTVTDLAGNTASVQRVVTVVAAPTAFVDFVPDLLATTNSNVNAFISRSNTTRIHLTHNGVPVNFAQFTRLYIKGFPADIDSAVTPLLFDTLEGDGTLDLLLGGAVSTPGVYRLTLIAYGTAHAGGVVLIAPELPYANVTVLVASA